MMEIKFMEGKYMQMGVDTYMFCHVLHLISFVCFLFLFFLALGCFLLLSGVLGFLRVLCWNTRRAAAFKIMVTTHKTQATDAQENISTPST